MTLIESMARAMFERDQRSKPGPYPLWHDLPMGERVMWQDFAIAALQVIRDNVTEGMVGAGDEAGTMSADGLRVWHAMINAALEERV